MICCIRRMLLWKHIEIFGTESISMKKGITLAYYNINSFSRQSAEILENTFNRLNKQKEFGLELNTDDLYYQKFRSINDYINILPIRK